MKRSGGPAGFFPRVLMAALLAGAGCSPNRGPATRAYLKGERDCVAEFTAATGPGPAFAIPRGPRTGTESADATLLYSKELVLYYSQLLGRLSQLSNALAHVQGRLGTLDPGGVDPQAADFAAAEEALFAADQALVTEVSLVYNRQRADLMRELQPTFFDRNCLPAAVHALDPASGGLSGAKARELWTVFSTLSDTGGEAAALKAEIEARTARLRELEREAREAGIAAGDAEDRLRSSLPPKYRAEDWGFLGPRETAR